MNNPTLIIISIININKLLLRIYPKAYNTRMADYQTFNVEYFNNVFGTTLTNKVIISLHTYRDNVQVSANNVKALFKRSIK